MTDCERFDELKDKMKSAAQELTDEEINLLVTHEDTCQRPEHEAPMEEVMSGDLMKNPRTRPIAQNLAARLRREFVKLNKKRPAHEVILNMLEYRVAEILRTLDVSNSPQIADFVTSQTLFILMNEMITPAKHRRWIIDYLLNLCKYCKRRGNSSTILYLEQKLCELVRKLEDEDAVKTKTSAASR